MAGCNERVGRGTLTWPCTLDPNHDGPHYALESPGDRRRWEAEQRAKAEQASATLAQFQGQPQTTAQRYTENPAPVPLSPGRRSLHRDCKPWECYVYDGDHSNRLSAQRECPTYDGSLPPTIGDPEQGTEVGKQTRTTPEDEVAFEGQVTEVDARGNREVVLEAPQCGARHTLGHGDNAVCELPPGHDGNHLDTSVQGPAFGWWSGAVDLDRVDPRVLAGEKIVAEGQFEIQPTKQREGDQRLPTGDTSISDDQSLVIADIERRRQVGIERYGQGHRPFNGRNTLLDGYEEVLDLLVYWRSLLRGREATREELVGEVERAFQTDSKAAGWPPSSRALAEVAVDRILDAVMVRQATDG